MDCPRCNTPTKVSETRGVFRDRRCPNAVCGFAFTTRESVVTLGDARRLCARTRDIHLVASPPRAAEAKRGQAAGELRNKRSAGDGSPPPHKEA